METQTVIVIDSDDESAAVPVVQDKPVVHVKKVKKAAQTRKPKTKKATKSAPAREAFVYLLHTGDEVEDATYIGCAYDVDHRLRQHNGEIAGGAETTKKWVRKNRLWTVACTVQVPSLQAARILERQWKKRGNVVNQRPIQKTKPLVERKRVALEEVLATYGPKDWYLA